MKITKAEQDAIKAVLKAGTDYGFGNMIAHLQTRWAECLMGDDNYPEAAARRCAGPGYPFRMQRELIERGEWDETGKRYRKPAKRKAVKA